MNSRDAVYWIMGALELGEIKTLNERQVKCLRSHLDMVFIHEIDPCFPEEQQSALDEAHGGSDPPPKPSRSVPKC